MKSFFEILDKSKVIYKNDGCNFAIRYLSNSDFHNKNKMWQMTLLPEFTLWFYDDEKNTDESKTICIAFGWLFWFIEFWIGNCEDLI